MVSQAPVEDFATRQQEDGKSKEVRLPFPCKVYDMLEDADGQGFDHIVSWNSEGNGFMVHNKDLFTNEIIPLYFNQTKYKSFQRQLSLYGFQRITGGNSKGLRYHQKLCRGSRQNCREMKPVGYKPRGPGGAEKREVRQGQSPQKTSTKRTMSDTDDKSSPKPPGSSEKSTLPAVVSSNSLCKQENQEKPITVSPELSPVKTESVIIPRDLISSNDIGFFEGMPFYLMSTASESKSSESKPYQVPETKPPALEDGPLKKAWEIGFQVAMTLNPSNFSSVVDTTCVDALNVNSNLLVR